MDVAKLAKRRFGTFVAILVATTAYLHARAVTWVVATTLSRDLPVPRPLSARPTRAGLGPSDHTTRADAILERNPFDSVTGPLHPPEADEDGGVASEGGVFIEGPDGGALEGNPTEAPACSGVHVSLITESSDPDWSFAGLEGTDGKVVLRRRGSQVGDFSVRFIGPEEVWLSGPGGLCQAKMFVPEAKEAPKVAATAPVRRAGGGPGVDPAIAKGIARVSATEFNIDRGVIDRILENQAELMRQARIVPESENGHMVGIRLFGVRPDTLLGLLGMQNGDRLQTINGFDMTSPEKALEAYARLRTADHLTVQVNRAGQNTNLDYNIR